MKATLPVSVLSLTMLALGAESVIRGSESPDEELSASARIDAGLELSFLRLQQEAQQQKISPEQMRLRAEQWYAANLPLIKQSETLKATDSVVPPPESPGSPPLASNLSPAEFLETANQYSQDLVNHIGSRPGAPDDPEEMRVRMEVRLKEPEMVAFERAVAKARYDLQQSQTDATPPRTGQELDGLTKEELAEEEIYAAIYTVTREPLQQGEEMRDRIAPLDAWIKTKRKSYQGEVSLLFRQQMDERIQHLESLLQESSDTAN